MGFKLILLFGLFAAAKASVSEDYHPRGYFSNDVTGVTWMHGANSKALLAEALEDESLRMLEGDIVMGTLLGSNSTEPVPIMAHPPVNESDLSVEMLLTEIIRFNKDQPLEKRKGVKLDYKEGEAADISLPLLKNWMDEDPNQLQFPIWINADIFPGPVNASTEFKVNGTTLVNLQKEMVPNATLSLGWSTRYAEGGSYTQEQFREMSDFLKEINSTAPITFPLRAQLALNVTDELLDLLDNSGIDGMTPSVTLWEGASDPRVSQEDLDKFVETIGMDRVFVDLPHSFPGVNGSGPAIQSTGGSSAVNTSVKNLLMTMTVALSFLFKF